MFVLMLVLMLQHVSSRVSGFPLASPCLWGKLQNLSFSKVSKQVVMSFCVASMALCDIPATCVVSCRKSFCVAGEIYTFAPFSEDELQFSWFERSTLHLTLHTPHSTFHALRTTLPTPHFTLYTRHFTPHMPHFTLHTLHFALSTLHFTLHTLHFTPHTLHSTLYTPHSTHDTAHFTL